MLAIGVILGVLCGIVLVFSIQAAFILLSAKICSISPRSFGQALATAIVGGICSAICSGLVQYGSGSMILGWLTSFAVMALTFSKFFETTFGKAALATIVANICGTIVIGGIALVILAAVGGLAALGQ